jgi:hypothetical protein
MPVLADLGMPAAVAARAREVRGALRSTSPPRRVRRRAILVATGGSMLLLALALACDSGTTTPPPPPPAAPTPPSSGPPPVAPQDRPAPPPATGPDRLVPSPEGMPATYEVRGAAGGSLLQLWPTQGGAHARLSGGGHGYTGAAAATPASCVLDLDGPRSDEALSATSARSATGEIRFEGKDKAVVTADVGTECGANSSFDGPYVRLPPSRDPLSLCRPGEAPYFACITEKGWQIAVCGSPSMGDPMPTLQYRFGKPGDVRLAWPAGGAAPDTSFRLSEEVHVRSTSTNLKFDNDGFAYTVYVQEGSGADNGAGVLVEEAGKAISAHACTYDGLVDRLATLKTAVAVEAP